MPRYRFPVTYTGHGFIEVTADDAVAAQEKAKALDFDEEYCLEVDLEEVNHTIAEEID